MAEQPGPGVSVFQPPRQAASNPAPAAPVVRSTPPSDVRQASTVRSNPSQTPAQALWQRDYDALTAADDFRRQDIVITKNPDGSLSTRPRTGNGKQTGARDAAAQPAQPEQTGQMQGLASQTAEADGGKIRIGQYELSESDVAGLLERKGVEESRKLTVPSAPEGYRLEVTPDVGAFAFKTDDPVSGPLLEQARQVAHASGMSQENFSKMLSLYAASQTQERQVLERAKAAELAKLGALAPVRIDALQTWVRGLIGDADAKPIMTNLWTAAQVHSLERLMEKYVNGGVGGGSPGAFRDGGANKPGKLTDEQYGQLSYHDKIQYAERMSRGGG